MLDCCKKNETKKFNHSEDILCKRKKQSDWQVNFGAKTEEPDC